MSETRARETKVIELPSPLLHPRAADALLLAGSPYPPARAASVKKRADIIRFEPADRRQAAGETERVG